MNSHLRSSERIRRDLAMPDILRLRSALALGAVVMLAGACTPLDDAMVAVFGRSMRSQRSFDPYEAPQLPPEGSVPFAAGNLQAAPFEVNVGQPEGVAEAPPPFTSIDMLQRPEIADGMVNPVPVSPESLVRGEVVYNRVCAVCHGPDGAGSSSYIIAVHPVMAAWPLTSERARGLTNGYIYGMIRVGRGLMPAYGHQVTHFDRWHVVNYVRQLQDQTPLPAGDGAAE